MKAKRTRNGGSSAAIAVFALLAVAAATTVAWAADCKLFQLDFDPPDLATTTLKDGNYSLGSTATAKGQFEAFVTVKGKVISAPWFTIGGKAMKPIAESDLPKEVQACLKSSPTTSPSSEGWLGGMLGSPGDWMGVRCKVTGGCVDAIGGGGYCWARANCSGSIAFSHVAY